MTPPKLLLLSGSIPNRSGVGGIFVDDLCSLYPPDRVSCFVLPAPGDAPPSAGLDLAAFRQAPQPFTRGADPRAGRLGQLATCARYQWGRWVREPQLVRQIVAFARQQRVERVWAFLAWPFMYRLATAVADALDLPLTATVWDPPEALALNCRLDPITRRIVRRDFARALRRCETCSVMCEAMQTEYETRFGTRCVILRHGLSEALWQPPAPRRNGNGRFTIGFAGSLNGTAEWRALLRALDSVGWKLDGNEIGLRTLCYGLSVENWGPARVEHFGWRPIDETIRLLAETDVTYLPFYSQRARRPHVRLAFPSKLTTYLAAGRPVLHHSSPESSVTRFFERYPAGLCCHSLEPGPILAALRRFISDAELYRQATAAGRSALQHELSRTVFRRRLAELFDVSQDELRPLDVSQPSTTTDRRRSNEPCSQLCTAPAAR